VDSLGDANTSFFRSVVNGRRRKKQIISINDGERVLVDLVEIKDHIMHFYKNLCGSEPEPVNHLDELWGSQNWVTSEKMSA
jgi:hypothetical protein